MVIEILLGIIAASSVTLLILLIVILIRVKKFREKALNVLEEIEEEIRPVSYEVRELLDNLNEISIDVKQKLDDVDGLFKIVGNIGSYQGSCERKESKVESIGCKIAEIVECVSCGISLFNKMRK